jgi:hypothetical protein
MVIIRIGVCRGTSLLEKQQIRLDVCQPVRVLEVAPHSGGGHLLYLVLPVNTPTAVASRSFLIAAWYIHTSW